MVDKGLMSLENNIIVTKEESEERALQLVFLNSKKVKSK